MDPERLARPRPPGSRAESGLGRYIAARLQALGLETRLQPVRTPTSPSWVPLVGAALRLSAAILLAGSLRQPALFAALLALVVMAVPRSVASLLASLPAVGGKTANVIARIRGRSGVPDAPLVIAAHLDTHPTAGRPLRRAHVTVTRLSAVVLAVAALWAVLRGRDVWPFIPALAGLESTATILWLARGELDAAVHVSPDDNSSGLQALLRIAESLARRRPVREVWLVASAGATSGGSGIRSFLAAHRRTAKTAWVLELDALGDWELVCCPARRRVPRRRTHPAIVRAVAGAALDTGDAIDVRYRNRPHSDADEAFRTGTHAVTITAGLKPPGAEYANSDGNVERVAAIIVHLARTTL